MLLLKLLFLKELFKGWIIANLIGFICNEFFKLNFIISNYFYMLSLIFIVISLELESYKRRMIFYKVLQVEKCIFRIAKFILIAFFITIQILLF